MTDHAELRAAALALLAALPVKAAWVAIPSRPGMPDGNWDVETNDGHTTWWPVEQVSQPMARYIALASPDVVLGLLDRIAELEAIWLGVTRD